MLHLNNAVNKFELEYFPNLGDTGDTEQSGDTSDAGETGDSGDTTQDSISNGSRWGGATLSPLQDSSDWPQTDIFMETVTQVDGMTTDTDTVTVTQSPYHQYETSDQPEPPVVNPGDRRKKRGVDGQGRRRVYKKRRKREVDMERCASDWIGKVKGQITAGV